MTRQEACAAAASERCARASAIIGPDSVVATIRQHPVAAVATALAGGLVLSRILSCRGIGWAAQLVVAPILRMALANGTSPSKANASMASTD
jgi:hypothetical protein